MSFEFSNPGKERIRRGENAGSGCKGICVRYKAQRPVSGGRYAMGQKRCQICEIFIKPPDNGLWCPCCGYRLRGKPRNKKYKELLRERNV